jgi:AraC-like DNA-binding protein
MTSEIRQQLAREGVIFRGEGILAIETAATHAEQEVFHGESLSLRFATCSGGYTLKTPVAGCYEFRFPQEGVCRVRGPFGTADVKPGDVLIVDPDHYVTQQWTQPMSQFVLRIERRAIEGTVACEHGRRPARRVTFEPVSVDPGIRAWLSVVATTFFQADNDIAGDRRVIKSIEEALIVMLLTGLHHSESDGLWRSGQGPAPYYVKRAEEYIHANARNAISVQDLVSHAKVSTRTLFYGFNKWRGKTPMAYIRDTRLDLARRELQQTGSLGGSVSRAAINSGFSNFSQFSRIYKDRFGEAPSATLRGK